MTEYYFITTEDPDDINMVAGLVKLGVLERDVDAHNADYCDHDYCHEECVDEEFLNDSINEAKENQEMETEEEILDNLDEYASATIELKDAGCGCHSSIMKPGDGLIEAGNGEYYLINTDTGNRR
jgi:hypothetical protein